MNIVAELVRFIPAQPERESTSGPATFLQSLRYGYRQNQSKRASTAAAPTTAAPKLESFISPRTPSPRTPSPPPARVQVGSPPYMTSSPFFFAEKEGISVPRMFDAGQQHDAELHALSSKTEKLRAELAFLEHEKVKRAQQLQSGYFTNQKENRFFSNSPTRNFDANQMENRFFSSNSPTKSFDANQKENRFFSSNSPTRNFDDGADADWLSRRSDDDGGNRNFQLWRDERQTPSKYGAGTSVNGKKDKDIFSKTMDTWINNEPRFKDENNSILLGVQKEMRVPETRSPIYMFHDCCVHRAPLRELSSSSAGPLINSFQK